MKYLKTYENYNEVDIIDENADFSNIEFMLEKLFGSSEEDKKEELKRILEPTKLVTLKSFCNKVLESDKLIPSRLLTILKKVFFDAQGWSKNPHKYDFFAELAKAAMTTDSDEDWEKVLGLLNFAMKSGVKAAPYWNKDKKVWEDKSRAGSAGL